MEVFSGFLAGLSVGVYCIGACLPIFVPLLLSQKRDTKSSFRVVLEFSLGRFLGYLTFGFLVGYLGEKAGIPLIYQLASLATLLMGAFMVGYSFGLLSWGAKACARYLGPVKIPLLLGFLTGVNLCPPFLASLSYVFDLKNVLRSVFYFAFFFLGTSLYIIPLAFLGVFSQKTVFQKIARISGIFIGLYFVWMGFKTF
jgi:sulfite exporter TauE/SafE